MIKSIKRVMTAIVVGLIVTVSAGAPQASALVADNCYPKQYCGRVVNSMYSNASFTIYNTQSKGGPQTLGVSYPSDFYTWYHDTDMVYIPSSCWVVYFINGVKYAAPGPRYIYIRDTDNIALINKC